MWNRITEAIASVGTCMRRIRRWRPVAREPGRDPQVMHALLDGAGEEPKDSEGGNGMTIVLFCSTKGAPEGSNCVICLDSMSEAESAEELVVGAVTGDPPSLEEPSLEHGSGTMHRADPSEVLVEESVGDDDTFPAAGSREWVTLVRCQHFFHADCLAAWFEKAPPPAEPHNRAPERAPSCPTCRADPFTQAAPARPSARLRT